MNETSDMQLIAERLESLKAGLIGGLSVCFAFALTTLLNTLVLPKYFPTLASLQNELNWHWWISAALATFTGFLFGVTYRYIIRSDQNPQLKAGGVLAFGLVRGLTQIEIGINYNSIIWPFCVLAFESGLWFGIAAIAVDMAIQLQWVKAFSSISNK